MALSFKKLTSAANIDYYASPQAHEESYYAGDRAEAAGVWIGPVFKGRARHRQKCNEVVLGDFRWLCDGYDPVLANRFMKAKGASFDRRARELETRHGLSAQAARLKSQREMRKALREAAALTQNAGADNRVKAFDLCFSAPKEISVLWALADADARKKIEQCQRLAVERAAAYLNDHLVVSPRGHGGKRLESAIAPLASFGHFTSRAGDPNIHTHLVMPNVCQRPDGTHGVVESAKILRWQSVIENIYHAELACQMVEAFSLSIEVTPSQKAFNLAGTSAEFQAGVNTFSKRRQQVIEAAGGEEAARSLSRAAEAHASTKDRAQKEVLPAVLKRGQWIEEAAQVGLTCDAAQSMLGPPSPLLGRPNDDDLERMLTELEEELTQSESAFSEARFLGRLCFKLQGQASAATILSIGKGWLSTLVNLGHTPDGETVYSTSRMIRLEAQMLADAKHLVPQHALFENIVESVIASRQSADLKAKSRAMTEEQADAVRHVVYSPRTCSIYSGAAGSGKSFSGAVIKECLEQAGYSIVGLSLSWKAAEVMRLESGIANARAIAGFLKEIAEGKIRLGPKSAVIIDEAGLVDSRSMGAILAAVRKAGGKVILTGDTRQLMPVAAGGAMNSLATELGEARIDTVRRQKLEWQRKAGTNIALGDTANAVAAFADGRCFNIAKDRNATMDALVGDWAKYRNGSPQLSSIVIAVTRKDVAQLNERMRHTARKEGWIRGKDVTVTISDGRVLSDAQFAVGDQVQFRKNLRDSAIYNRNVGTIEAIGPDASGVMSILIRLDDGRLHVCAARENDLMYDPEAQSFAMEHAWAMTCYSSQGQTKNRSFILHDERMDRRLAYVAMSRHTDDVTVYVDKSAAHAQWNSRKPSSQWKPVSKMTREDALAVVTKNWSRLSTKMTTCDFVRQKESVEETNMRFQVLRDEERRAIQCYRLKGRADDSRAVQLHDSVPKPSEDRSSREPIYRQKTDQEPPRLVQGDHLISEATIISSPVDLEIADSPDLEEEEILPISHRPGRP